MQSCQSCRDIDKALNTSSTCYLSCRWEGMAFRSITCKADTPQKPGSCFCTHRHQIPTTGLLLLQQPRQVGAEIGLIPSQTAWMCSPQLGMAPPGHPRATSTKITVLGDSGTLPSRVRGG